MSEHDIEFDWSPLGESFWRSAAEACTHKPSELQLRMACCLQSGLNASDSAARAGYEGDEGAIRVAGHRASKSTAVMELLSYAKAETGQGDDGIVSGKEARRILSRIARKGNNNERIKSLEALARLDQAEATASAGKSDTDVNEELAALIGSIPQDAVGALLAMCWWSTNGSVAIFPFLKECGPRIAQAYPKQWQQWLGKETGQWAVSMDRVATTGEVLSDDALVAAVKGKLPRPLTVTVDD